MFEVTTDSNPPNTFLKLLFDNCNDVKFPWFVQMTWLDFVCIFNFFGFMMYFYYPICYWCSDYEFALHLLTSSDCRGKRIIWLIPPILCWIVFVLSWIFSIIHFRWYWMVFVSWLLLFIVFFSLFMLCCVCCLYKF